jgi:hypothetical protein
MSDSLDSQVTGLDVHIAGHPLDGDEATHPPGLS